MQAGVKMMLRESRAEQEEERRSLDRVPFVRPVRILGHSQAQQTFSRDISAGGIGLIGTEDFEVGTIAYLVVHSINGCSVTLKSEVAWSRPFGSGWFLTGWQFTD